MHIHQFLPDGSKPGPHPAELLDFGAFVTVSQSENAFWSHQWSV